MKELFDRKGILCLRKGRARGLALLLASLGVLLLDVLLCYFLSSRETMALAIVLGSVVAFLAFALSLYAYTALFRPYSRLLRDFSLFGKANRERFVGVVADDSRLSWRGGYPVASFRLAIEGGEKELALPAYFRSEVKKGERLIVESHDGLVYAYEEA